LGVVRTLSRTKNLRESRECPKCGSAAYLSRRRGLREGILLRILLHAKYRCSHCGRRWMTYLPKMAFRKARRSETMAEYIGCGDETGHRVLYRTFFVTLAIICVMGVFFHWATERKRITVNASGQLIREPLKSKLTRKR
jgi:hypothetical protein